MRGRLLVLFITAFVDMVGLTMLMPLLPFYARELGGSATLIGLLIAAFSAAQLTVAPMWGRMSDRYGRRPAILAGLLVTAAAYVLFAFAGSLWLLLLSRIVQGIGGGTIGVVQAYVADASPPDRRTRSLGSLSAVTSLGAVAGPAFGPLLIQLGGRRGPGLGAAALALLVAGFAWRYLKESRVPAAAAGAGADLVTGRAAVARTLTRWREPASRLIWVYAVGIGGFYGTGQIAPLLLASRFGITERTVGFFIMYLGGMGVLIRSLLLGPIVDRLGEGRLARLGILLLAAGLTATGLAHDYVLLGLGFTLMPLGTAFLFPCITSLLSRIISSRERGLYMGVMQTFGGISRTAFPVAAGRVMDGFGVGVPFWAAGTAVLLTLPLTRGIRSLGRREPTPQPVTPEGAIAAADVTGEFPVAPPQRS